jgi:hypothetical protein
MGDGSDLVAIEVRTTTRRTDPADAADEHKRRHVGRLGRSIGATRIDVVAIRLGTDALVVHWIPSVN